MYTIEFTTKRNISERLKNLLKKALQDADPEATCQVDHATCTISGAKASPEQLSYLLGIAIGGRRSNEIMKMTLSYEKLQ